MAIRITCINKDNGYHENPNLAITHLGWIGDDGKPGKSTRLEIYNWIKNEWISLCCRWVWKPSKSYHS